MAMKVVIEQSGVFNRFQKLHLKYVVPSVIAHKSLGFAKTKTCLEFFSKNNNPRPHSRFGTKLNKTAKQLRTAFLPITASNRLSLAFILASRSTAL